MSFGITFDARQVAPNVIPEPVPSGMYMVAIIKSEEKPTASNPGATYYEFTMQILDGEHKGRTVVDRLNCKNPNEQTVQIAYGTLSSICYVTGVMQLNNSQELHGKPFKVNVIKQPRTDNPALFNNNVRQYLNLDGSEPGKQAAAPAAAAPAFATGAAAAPPSFAAPQTNGATAPAPAAPAPAAPPPPTVAAPPPPAVFPPEGWTAHPTAPGYFYKGSEVLTEEQLRAMSSQAPAVPAPPAFQPGTPAQQAAPQAAAPSATPSWAQ